MQSIGPGGRNRYVDLVRLVAIVVVVVGHWLDTTILVVRGRPVGESALAAAGYMRWLTLLFQVMPLFFLAGGYAAAASWPSWRSRGGHWAGWTHGRFVRLLRPTTWFVAIMAGVAAVASLLGAEPSVLAQAGWAVALQLWFLPVYLLLLVLAVSMVTAWNRVGWSVLGAAVVLVAVVDVVVRVVDLPAAGWVNYLVAPAAGFLLGIAWHAGALSGRVPIALLAGGALILLMLIALMGYPPWMIGVPGEPPANTSPPNLALMAYSAAQIGAVLLLETPLRRILQGPRAWSVVVRGNSVVMTLYLWHMVPVLILAAIIVGTGLPTGPPAGTASWWGLRSFWIGALSLLLAGVIRLVGRFERPGPPRPSLAGWGPCAMLLACAALTGYALSRLALGGFAPRGHIAVGPLAIYATGMIALWLAGLPFGTAHPRARPIGS
jgi:fucose 4-O-acetylase-like acetyltransferase